MTEPAPKRKRVTTAERLALRVDSGIDSVKTDVRERVDDVTAKVKAVENLARAGKQAVEELPGRVNRRLDTRADEILQAIRERERSWAWLALALAASVGVGIGIGLVL